MADAAAAAAKEPIKSVQTYGRKKTATAVAYCKRGKGVLNVNGKPLEQVDDSGNTPLSYYWINLYALTSF